MSKSPMPKQASKKIHLAKPTAFVPEPEVKHGQVLLAKVQARKDELAQALKRVRAETPKGEAETGSASEIDKALMAVETLLTGELANIDASTAAELSRWLETSAVLPARKVVRRPSPAPAANGKSAARVRSP